MRYSQAIFICILGTSFYCFDYFAQVTPSVMSQQLMQHFHLNAAGLGLLSSSFFLPYCCMQLPAGLLLQRFGTRTTLTVAALISAIALILFANTDHWISALIARALLGGCAAFSFVSALFLIAQWFPTRLFAPLTGAIQFSATAGSIIGLAPIAKALHHYHWQFIILTMGLFALLLSALFALAIRDRTTEPVHQQSLALKSTIQCIRHQPRLMIIFAVGFISWIPISSMGALWGVPYLVSTLQISTAQAAHDISFLWIGLAIGSFVVGWLSECIQHRAYMSIICFLLALSSSLIIIFFPHMNQFSLQLALFALGFSAGNQALSFAYLKDQVPSTLFCGLSGINNMSAILGGALAQISIGYSLSWQQHVTQIHTAYNWHQYQHALIIIPIAAACGLALCRPLFTLTRPTVLPI